MKRQRLGIRHNRSFLLAEKQEFVGEEDVGTLKVGHVGFARDGRGCWLANRLV